VELDRRGRDAGQRASAVHPGLILTELGRYMTKETFESMPFTRGDRDQLPAAKSIPAGAATSVWTAFVADADDVGGCFCEDCHVAEVTHDRSARGGVNAYAVDPERAAALWARSEELVGEAFPD